MGEKKWCRVRRFRCPHCRKTFTRLPHFLIPFKHYMAREIEHVLRSILEGCPLTLVSSGAEESTLRRWQKEFKRKLQSWAGSLESKASGLFGEYPDLLSIPFHPLKRLEQALSRLPALPPAWPVLVKALHLINPSYPLCIV